MLPEYDSDSSVTAVSVIALFIAGKRKKCLALPKYNPLK
jgi:hypothetical protein